MPQIYFSLGTNLGDRHRNLHDALLRLAPVVSFSGLSPIYQTPPWGPISDQPPFLNLCASGRTVLTPLQLLQRCKEIEQELGRHTGERWGPRLIDIDLLFYDQLIRQENRLTLPHPQIGERGFVLRPLADIAPDLIHPVHDQTIADLLQTVDAADIVRVAPPPRIDPLLPWGSRTFIMGILNITPDSFSEDGLIGSGDPVKRALIQAERFTAAGADILDVGGESTRPGADPLPAAEEQKRILPVIRALRDRLPESTISVDTYRASVAAAALDAGASWINDVSGGRADPEMLSLAAGRGCPIILMHNGRNRPRRLVDDGTGRPISVFAYESDDFLAEIVAETALIAHEALTAGVRSENLLLDPGIGFGKAGPQNLALLHHIGRFKALGYPVLVGPSRKGFIGHYLGGLPVEERLEGTAAAVALAIAGGADIVRVHDVQAMARVARLSDLIVRRDY